MVFCWSCNQYSTSDTLWNRRKDGLIRKRTVGTNTWHQISIWNSEQKGWKMGAEVKRKTSAALPSDVFVASRQRARRVIAISAALTDPMSLCRQQWIWAELLSCLSSGGVKEAVVSSCSSQRPFITWETGTSPGNRGRLNHDTTRKPPFFFPCERRKFLKCEIYVWPTMTRRSQSINLKNSNHVHGRQQKNARAF